MWLMRLASTPFVMSRLSRLKTRFNLAHSSASIDQCRLEQASGWCRLRHWTQHQFYREQHGGRLTMVRRNYPRSWRWPKSYFRNQMKSRFHCQVFCQRWQIERMISRHAAHWNQPYALANRQPNNECRLRIQNHNVVPSGSSLLFQQSHRGCKFYTKAIRSE